MTDDLKQRLREYELDSEAWLAADRIEQLEAERDELLADAMRYRWLREQNETLTQESFVVLSSDVECQYCESTWVGTDLDAAIDAVIAKLKGQDNDNHK